MKIGTIEGIAPRKMVVEHGAKLLVRESAGGQVRLISQRICEALKK